MNEQSSVMIGPDIWIGAQQGSMQLSIVIPTYRREEVLAATIESLLDLSKLESTEIILVDQSPDHKPEVADYLRNCAESGFIKWIRQEKPSIPGAMNRGAMAASGEILLFLDDDVVPDGDLLNQHVRAHQNRKGDLIVGKVLQPWHDDGETSARFTHTEGHVENQFIGCNFSIGKSLLEALGGFDENFKGAAYCYEREFGDRLNDAGKRMWYEPAAAIRHLHHQSGGTRSKGDHLTSWNPRHPVGAYYYLFSSPLVKGRAFRAIGRFFRAVITRHHLKNPWYIPVTMVSELGGLVWALGLRLKGPALPLSKSGTHPEPG